MLLQYVLPHANDEFLHHLRQHTGDDELWHLQYFAVILCKVLHHHTSSLILVKFEQEVDEFTLVSRFMQIVMLLPKETVVRGVAIDGTFVGEGRHFVAVLLVVEHEDLLGERVDEFYVWVGGWFLVVNLEVLCVPNDAMRRFKKLTKDPL